MSSRDAIKKQKAWATAPCSSVAWRTDGTAKKRPNTTTFSTNVQGGKNSYQGGNGWELTDELRVNPLPHELFATKKNHFSDMLMNFSQ